MNFIDQTEIFVKAGRGGDGMISFRRARNMPKLGSDGGNGGLGGDIYLVGREQINTLSSLRYRACYDAPNGGRGGTDNCTGHCGETLKIPVPCGTVVYDAPTGLLLGEILGENDQLLVAKGGARGYGNLHYVSPTRQAPDFGKEGQKGTHAHLRLELKLMADIGLVGYPNAGKSTLLSALSSARPKIADYPFTTLAPELGVVDTGDLRGTFGSYVVADLPGLIDGASRGKGLGFQFLRHVERTKLLAFVLDGFSEEDAAVKAYESLSNELETYDAELLKRPRVILLNKVDLEPDSIRAESLKNRLAAFAPVCLVSGAAHMGLSEAKMFLRSALISHHAEIL